MAAKTGLKPSTYAATAWLAVRCCCACWTLCAISCAVRQEVWHVNLGRSGDQLHVWGADFGPRGFRERRLDLQTRADGFLAGPRCEEGFAVGVWRFQYLQEGRGDAVRGIRRLWNWVAWQEFGCFRVKVEFLERADFPEGFEPVVAALPVELCAVALEYSDVASAVRLVLSGGRNTVADGVFKNVAELKIGDLLVPFFGSRAREGAAQVGARCEGLRGDELKAGLECKGAVAAFLVGWAMVDEENGDRASAGRQTGGSVTGGRHGADGYAQGEAAAVGFEVLYIDATDGQRVTPQQEQAMQKAGIAIGLGDSMPDILLWNPKTDALWVVEAVTSDGEVDSHKVQGLTALAKRCGKTTIGFTTAYMTWRDAATRQGKHKNIAPGTCIWIREDGAKQFSVETFESSPQRLNQ